MKNNKIIIANWKMAPTKASEARRLFKKVMLAIYGHRKSIVVVASSFIHLPLLSSIFSSQRSMRASLKLGAQDVFWENPPTGGGAYTGEISPRMLRNLGVEYVIIGHSERRQYFKETDEMINKKVKAALESGLKVILCVGESDRTTNDKRQTTKAKNYIKKQLEKDLKGIEKSLVVSRQSLVITYEPVWAISTNKNAKPDTPENALEMIKFIRQILNSKFHILNSRVLYGGSVNSKNIESFLKHKEIDGALVGGASLTSDFIKIIKIAQKYA